MSEVVLDSSVALCWCFPDEDIAYADSVIDSLEMNRTALVPVMWRFEIANALLVAERRGRTTEADSAQFLGDLLALPIEEDSDGSSRVFSEVLPLARRLRIASYDASYLDLCLRTGLPLATVDDGMKRAAAAVGIALYRP